VDKVLVQSYKTPFGELQLGSYAGALCLCDWRRRLKQASIYKRISSRLGSSFQEGSSPVIESAKDQLESYFARQIQRFELPLLTLGTDFQKSVWQALIEVPYGATSSYADLARSIGKPEAVRAVASANGANALSLFIPCHRIIGSDGALVGYAGGLAAKRRLLSLEQAH